MRATGGIILAALLVGACGGASETVGASDAASNADGSGDAWPVDAATQTDGGCVNPVEGQRCTATDTVCPSGVDPCCQGYIWTCNSTSQTWTKAGLGCACMVSVPCGTTSCPQGDICVVEHISGGACIAPNDAGMCPDGSAPAGLCCTRNSTTYTCKARPTTCATLACGCDTTLCTQGSCQSASGDQVTCQLLAP